MEKLDQINSMLKEISSPLRLECLKEDVDYFFSPIVDEDSEFYIAYKTLNIRHYKSLRGPLTKWRMSASCLSAFIRNTDPGGFEAPTERVCKNCCEKKPMVDFSISFKNGNKIYWYSECKPCRSDIQNQKYSAIRAERDPHRYLQCDECSHIQIKYKNTKMGAIKTECVNCGGGEILPFI
jgi:hypothetical protein